MNTKNLLQHYIKKLWLPLLQYIFKIHKLKCHHFSVMTKQSRAKKEQTVSNGKVASHKSSTVFSPNKRATTEVIPVQHPFNRTLHLKLENILLPQHHFLTRNFLIASECCIVGSGKEVKAMSVKKPNAIPIRFAAHLCRLWQGVWDLGFYLRNQMRKKAANKQGSYRFCFIQI